MTARGLFIVLEGSEGSGKSTLHGALAARMREAGVDPVVVREPGATRAAGARMTSASIVPVAKAPVRR